MGGGGCFFIIQCFNHTGFLLRISAGGGAVKFSQIGAGIFISMNSYVKGKSDE